MEKKNNPLTVIKGGGESSRQKDTDFTLSTESKDFIRRKLAEETSGRIYADSEIDQINLALYHPDRATRSTLYEKAKINFPELLDLFERIKS